MDPWINRVLRDAELYRGPPARPPFPALPWFDGPYRGPELAFDLSLVAERVQRAQQLEQRHGCRFMLAVKAFAHPRVLELFASHGLGFDISNRGEFEAVVRAGAVASKLSLTGPLLHTVFSGGVAPHAVQGMQVNVSSWEEYERLPKDLPIVLGMRLNGSAGARSGSSRFGLAPAPLERVQAIARDPRFRGVHMHVNNDKPGYASKVDAALTWLSLTGVHIEYLNLGGGLEHFSLDELEALVASIRTRLPPETTLQFEPGEFWAHGGGHARTRVLEVSPNYLPDAHKVTLDISRVCHLQWSTPAVLLRQEGWQGDTERVVFYGCTCLDRDIVTAAELPRDRGGELMIRAGDELILSNVSSYSAMWNREFNGIAAAPVRLVGPPA